MPVFKEENQYIHTYMYSTRIIQIPMTMKLKPRLKKKPLQIKLLLTETDCMAYGQILDIFKINTEIKKNYIVIYSSHGASSINQTSATDGIMRLALRSVKSNNVDFLNQIRYFSIKQRSTRLAGPCSRPNSKCGSAGNRTRDVIISRQTR